MSRIGLNDSVEEMMYKMSEGNPGALTVCINLYKEVPRIDPQNLMGGLGSILMLDTLGVYSSDIWILYKDICGQSLQKLQCLLRAWQLGIISEKIISRGIKEQNADEINSTAFYSKVEERLPEFCKLEKERGDEGERTK